MPLNQSGSNALAIYICKLKPKSESIPLNVPQGWEIKTQEQPIINSQQSFPK